MKNSRLPTHFVSHGGGPWPYMKAELGSLYDKLEKSIQDIAREIGGKPRAVLIATAHWVAPEFTLSAGDKPPMLYDYSGFPPHTYQVQYRAPGSAELAGKASALLQEGGLVANLDTRRGFDHGTFSVLQPLYPEADIPVVQLSLKATFDPALHLKAGRLLAPLRDEGVLIIGSGLSYHNLLRMNASAAAPSREFDSWLQETLVQASPANRQQRLLQWAAAPSARIAHAYEDHLIPLLIAVGAADEDAGVCTYHEEDFFGHITVSSFRFGETRLNIESRQAI